ncbi:hypothetical protein P7K49_029878 [Saguinus oedipus]|uniref:Uncharacterized protein n=1 Tax=Saguinus oedipus TaxID=9490 RepID=A0ABQ9U8F9_SAGOE|nr:hypothetical protein P7K49_029878 [Saguinus oedipus]
MKVLGAALLQPLALSPGASSCSCGREAGPQHASLGYDFSKKQGQAQSAQGVTAWPGDPAQSVTVWPEEPAQNVMEELGDPAQYVTAWPRDPAQSMLVQRGDLAQSVVVQPGEPA